MHTEVLMKVGITSVGLAKQDDGRPQTGHNMFAETTAKPIQSST
jgi:hypothetical protein